MEKSLNELMPGEKGSIVKIVSSDRVTRRLIEMGLTIGTVIEVIRNAPLKDPIEIRVRGYNLSVRREDAKNIIVEVIEDG